MTPGREPAEAQLDARMAQLALGDRAAFAPLFHALWPRARRLACARLDPCHADDVAQSALLRVFAHASEFEPGRPVLPWFYAIVANEIRANRRAASHGAVRPQGEAASIDAIDPEAQLAERELARALECAVATLDAPAAAAIHALLGRGPAPAIEPPAFRKRVSRAYARLRLLLGEAYGR